DFCKILIMVRFVEGKVSMIAEKLLQEIELEATTTRNVLERVPSDRLLWKPHAKSMSLGVLAMHIAGTPGFITDWALTDSVVALDAAPEIAPKSVEEILSVHDMSIGKAKSALRQLGDEGLLREWKMTSKDGATLFSWPKASLVRSYALNHLYHH